MRIQHNGAALNSYRQQGIQGKFVSKSMEKLSSGMHINRAADDAAGLAISEKMRGQIRGLEKAQKNIKDGLSLVNVADAASAEVQEILQRTRELAVQSANDTNLLEDRLKIQQEIDQLITEIDRIANGTEFNTMSVLNGGYTSDNKQVDVPNLKDIVESLTETGGMTESYEISGVNYASASVDFSNLQDIDDVKELEGTGLHYTCGTCHRTFSIKFIEGTPNNDNMPDEHRVLEVDISDLENGEEVVKAILATAYGEEDFVYNPDESNMENLPGKSTNFVNHFSQLAAEGSTLHMYDYRPNQHDSKDTFPSADRRGVFEPIVYQGAEPEELFSFVKIQTGANEGQNLTLRLPNITTEQLNVERIFVTSQHLANNAIKQLDQAINKVSEARMHFGSYQNRLEHTYNNAAVTAENLASAESLLRDADIASEISKLEAKQIILQAAQAMGAQANQQMQGILELLG